VAQRVGKQQMRRHLFVARDMVLSKTSIVMHVKPAPYNKGDSGLFDFAIDIRTLNVDASNQWKWSYPRKFGARPVFSENGDWIKLDYTRWHKAQNN
jgi:hypothetical protein